MGFQPIKSHGPFDSAQEFQLEGRATGRLFVGISRFSLLDLPLAESDRSVPLAGDGRRSAERLPPELTFPEVKSAISEAIECDAFF